MVFFVQIKIQTLNEYNKRDNLKRIYTKLFDVAHVDAMKLMRN